MAKYLYAASYTPEGVRGLMQEGGVARRSTVEKVVAELGGRLEAFYFAFGDVDAYVIVDLPEQVRASAMALAINQSGAVTVKTVVLMTPEEVDQAIAQQVRYQPPGR